jgi:hypothetical protein
MITYVLGALIVGVAIGSAIGAAISNSRHRRAVPAPSLPPAQLALVEPVLTEPLLPAPVPEATAQPVEPATSRPNEPEKAVSQPSRAADTITNLQVAEAVLEVADRLASQELCRRLGDALRPLDGVSILMPEVGADFDPGLHDWVSTRAATDDHTARTVAATKVPGMALADGTVLRKARVIVFE